MHPTIVIGSLKIDSYTLLMIIGIIACVITTVFIFKKVERVDERTTQSILATGLLSGFVLYLSAFLFDALFHSIKAGKWTTNGITWLGGLLGAFPTMIILSHFYCPRIKGNVLYYFGLIMPGLAIGHAFGRVGCYLAGCCYGMPTNSAFGVLFPEGSSAALAVIKEYGANVPVIPTMLFEAIFEAVLFIIMIVFYKQLKKHFLETYLFGYGAFRFVLEFFRGDNRGATGLGLTPSQLIGLLMIIAGVLLILYYKRIIFKDLYDKMAEYRKQAEKYGVRLHGDVSATLRELRGLQKDGLITQEEYEAYKKTLKERL